MNFILLTLFFFHSCNLKSDWDKHFRNVFPENRPSDVVIIYSENGGMLNISEKIFISQDSCYYEKNKYGNIVKVDFILNAKELDSLYNIVRKNKFNEIETYSKTVYDRGGSFVSVMFGDTDFIKSNSGFSFIEKDWIEEYSNISGIINSTAQNAWNKKSRDFVVIVDNSLKDESGYIMFDNFRIFDGADVHFDDNGEMTDTLKLVDGKYSMNYKYLDDYGLESVFIINQKGIKIFSNNGKLAWKYF